MQFYANNKYRNTSHVTARLAPLPWLCDKHIIVLLQMMMMMIIPNLLQSICLTLFGIKMFMSLKFNVVSHSLTHTYIHIRYTYIFICMYICIYIQAMTESFQCLPKEDKQWVSINKQHDKFRFMSLQSASFPITYSYICICIMAIQIIKFPEKS